MAASPDAPDPHEALRSAVTQLKTAARIPAKQRESKVAGVVERVTARAYEVGVAPDVLEELVDLITTRNELDQASVNGLIRNLYPTEKVSDDIVIKVVCSLGHGTAKASFPAQAALLKWLVMVYDALENRRILSQLYAVLFNLLDTIAIRALLCHLLALITRRKHVRPFRIQMLLELARRAGNEPQIVGLIRVYKDYYPDVIVGDATRGRASVFTHPNPEWRKRLREVQEMNSQKQDNKSGQIQGFVTGPKTSKRGDSSTIPEVHTYHAQESSVTLEEVESVEDMVQKLEKIEMPNQIVAVIGNPKMQHLLRLKSSEALLRRIDNWLTAFFEDQLQDDSSSGGTIPLDMLRAVSSYASFTKRIPQACLAYIRSILDSWDGIEGQEVIFDLLSYIPIAPFTDVYKTTFKLLEDAVLNETPKSLLALLKFYSLLLRRWTVVLDSDTPLRSFGAAIEALTGHCNTLALTITQISLSTTSHQDILTFYEVTASLISQPNVQPYTRITIPPSELIYTLHFSPSVSTLSRLCAVLAVYKRAFESAMSKPAAGSPAVDPYPTPYVNLFNGFLMDICNCLWRSRAFNTTDTNALGCLLPKPLLPVLTNYVAKLDTGLTLTSIFTLSYSPTLCNLSISYIRALEDAAEDAAVRGGAMEDIQIRHAGPVTQKSLAQLGKDGGLKLSWPNYRLGVLDYLEGKGCMGVGELMYNTLKILMSARQEAREGAAAAAGGGAQRA